MPGALERPPHLRPEGEAGWVAQRPFAVAAAVAGVLAFAIAGLSTSEVWAMPDLRISVPGLCLTAGLAISSLARRETGAWPLWLLGLGLATSAIVLGYFLVVAIVVAAAVILVWILHLLI